jgi:ribose/xylose/arabinose/galactoside ABC-type transport system permease subunit
MDNNIGSIITEAETRPEGIRRRRLLEAARVIWRSDDSRRAAILAGLVAVLGIATKGLTSSRANVSNIMLQSSARGVATMGQTLVIIGGGFDISVGGTALMTGVLGAALLTPVLWQNIAGGPIPLGVAILIMVLAGLGVGMFNGFFVTHLGVNTVIMTLATWMMTKSIAYQISKGNTLYGLPRSLAFLGQGYIAGVPVSVIVFGVAAAIVYFVLNHTTYGRAVYAVGGNPVSSLLAGVKVRNIKFSTFAICSCMAALSAILSMSRSLTASMFSSGGLELDTIASCFIGGISMAGGKGTVFGAIVGVITLGVISNGMNVLGIHPSFQDLVKGSIIVGAVTIDVMRSRHKP